MAKVAPELTNRMLIVSYCSGIRSEWPQKLAIALYGFQLPVDTNGQTLLRKLVDDVQHPVFPALIAPERLLAVVREHWAIEKLHYVRDVSLNEDRCRVRAGARPLASLRNIALTLIRGTELSVPEARENFHEDRAAAIAAVTNCKVFERPCAKPGRTRTAFPFT